jgi:hypothetical protein
MVEETEVHRRKLTDLQQFTDKLYLINYRNHFLWDSENPYSLTLLPGCWVIVLNKNVDIKFSTYDAFWDNLHQVRSK